MELKNSVNGGVYTYDYDSVGNVVKDELQAVNGIAWNAYGKVLSIPNKNVNYQYDATGNRVYKYAAGVTEYYVRDAQGNVMATYSNRAGAFAKSEQHLYGSSRLGLIDKPKALDLVNGVYLFKLGTGYKYEFIRGKKQFELTNHLGNVLATISDKKIPVSAGGRTIDYYLPDVVSATDYYPFGMTMPNRNYKSNSYTYGFEGIRKSTEINSDGNFYTFKFREYDARIGKFWSVDPLASKFPWQSPYSGLDNNPIFKMDPDGRAARPLDDHYINKDGSIRTLKTEDNFDRFYVQDNTNKASYRLAGQLNKNDAGLVQFPSSGVGFNRYGSSDPGGNSTSPAEKVGQGDHYLKPEVAAALFGVINKLKTDFGFNISLGDMSSSNGSDPWQPGFKHHAGHGHLGTRSGIDVDFRYLNTDGNSFQSTNAFNSSSFSSLNNQRVYDAASTFGFTKNYQGTSGNLTSVTKMGGHNDHGHLGLEYKNLDWKYVRFAPTIQTNNFSNIFFNFLNK